MKEQKKNKGSALVAKSTNNSQKLEIGLVLRKQKNIKKIQKKCKPACSRRSLEFSLKIKSLKPVFPDTRLTFWTFLNVVRITTEKALI